jgi:hypothetical protein
MVEEVVCQGRLIRTLSGGRLVLRSDDGVLPLESVLELHGFAAGDLLEVRLVRTLPRLRDSGLEPVDEAGVAGEWSRSNLPSWTG